MDLLSLSFVSAAALVGTLVLMLLAVALIADVMGLIRVDVRVEITVGEKPED